MDKHLLEIKEAVNYIKKIVNPKAHTAIILGSGLSSIVDIIEVEHSIDYNDIPYFPISTVQGHVGKLIFGKLNNTLIIALAGRFHFYEGYTPLQVVFAVRVLKFLGIKNLLLSNAAGGVNPCFKVGDLMIIKDHISFFVPNPLIGKNIPELGIRFTDMSEPYDKKFIALAKNIALQNNFELYEGVYFGVTGPTFETRAEYKMIKILGGDVVGMSTVQEAITAVHCGIKVFGISVITDIGIRDEENAITHEDVLHAAKSAEPKLSILFRNLVKHID